MASSKNDPLAPEPPKPSIPLKKSTLLMLVIVLGVLIVVFSLLFGGNTQRASLTPVQEAEKLPEPSVVGRSASLKQEEDDARKANPVDLDKERELARQNAKSPLPPELARNNNTSAVIGDAARTVDGRGYPSGAGAVGNTGVPSGAPVAATSDAELARVQAEQQVRGAKAMVFDISEPTGGMMKTATPAGTLPAPTVPSFGDLPPRTVTTPSQQVRPDVEAALQALKGTQTANQSARSWLKDYEAEGGSKGKVITSYKNASPYILHQGRVIPVVLSRKINSDLPGEISAVVTTDIYDSLGGGNMLIPKGTQLVGSYDSEVKVGQSRLLFAFKRLIMPNGVSFDLPAAQGSDLAGASGVTGDVNNHFWKMFTSSFLIAWLADKTTMPSSVTNIGGAGVPNAAGQVLVDVSKSILERNRTIQPTITIDQGTRLNVQVATDMVFDGPYRR